MDRVLREARARWPFLVALGLVLALDIALFALVKDLTQWDGIAAILQSIASSLVASLFVAVMILTYLPGPDEERPLKQIDSGEISPLLESAAKASRNWAFSGGSGRFLRAVTLPALLKTARDDHVSVILRVVLYDPDNSALCERYAAYRTGYVKTDKPWTAERVQIEIISTLFDLYCAAQATEGLDLRIALSQTMSALRYDISDKYAIITTDGKDTPAAWANAKSHYYEAYRSEVYGQVSQGRSINIERKLGVNTQYTSDAVAGALARMGLQCRLSASALDQIARTAEKRENPY